MSRMAVQGGGNFYFIEQPAQIADFLTSELGDALEVVARDARVVVSAGPGLDVSALNEFPVESREDGLHIRLGDLVSGQQVTVVVAACCQARPIGAGAALIGRLADRDAVLFAGPMRVEWTPADAASDAAQPVNHEVIVAAATRLAEQARAEALEANRRGDYKAAARILKTAAAAVRALGAGAREIEAIAATLEENEVVYFQSMSPMQLKEAHFASLSVRRGRDRYRAGPHVRTAARALLAPSGVDST